MPELQTAAFTNIASINILDPVTPEEIQTLSSAAQLNPAVFAGVKTKGDFYQKLNQARKSAASGGAKEQPATEAPAAQTPAVQVPAPVPAAPSNDKPATVKSAKKQARVTADHLNVGSGASSRAAILTSFPKGTVLDVIGPAKYGWVKIKFNGRTAYVYGQYINMLP
ncbi:SH3 domain-containing protein [Paenibacillus donghaensis]|uniref:SH3 domain-containing protein n=1 Tax=Paenibacillus donghaensis TaxID=414771 RepID=UPI0012FDAC0B|nr:SH3 domain-containing protein [Paenibacillus donghaensis]